MKAKTGTLFDFLIVLICLSLSSAGPGFFLANLAKAVSGPTFFTLYLEESLPKHAYLFVKYSMEKTATFPTGLDEQTQS